METGIVFDIRRHSLHDGPGIRTVFFLKGCPLSCAWCHNPEGISPEPETARRPERCVSCGACAGGSSDVVCPADARETIGLPFQARSVAETAARDWPFFAESGGGVTFSGGEPLSQPGFLIESLDECRSKGMHVAVDTSGLADAAVLEKVASRTDLFLFDLKIMDSCKHRLFTGVPNEGILRNLAVLSRNGSNVIVSVPVIGGVNDDYGNASETANFIKALTTVYPVRLLPYHEPSRAKLSRFGKEHQAFTPPSRDRMESLAEVYRSAGIHVIGIGGLS